MKTPKYTGIIAITHERFPLNLFLKYLFIFSIGFVFSSCSVAPIDIVKKRYDNLNESRDVAEVFRTDHASIVEGKKTDNNCTYYEIIYLNNINIKKEWKIVKFSTSKKCKSDIEREKKIQEKYLKWKSK